MKVIIRDVNTSEKDKEFLLKSCKASETALEIVCNKKLKTSYVLDILRLFLKYIFSLEDNHYENVKDNFVIIKKQNLNFILNLDTFKEFKKLYRLDIKESLLVSQSALRTNCKILIL